MPAAAFFLTLVNEAPTAMTSGSESEVGAPNPPAAAK